MASITSYATAAGRRYRVRYRKPDGRQTDKRGFPTKKAAEAFAATVEVSKLTGTYVDPTDSRTTVGELGPLWLERQRGHLKPSSWSPLEVAWRLRVEPRWGSKQIGQIRTSDVQSWVSDMSEGDPVRGVKPAGASVVIRTFGVLAAVLDDAARDRLINVSPARGVKLPRKTRSPKTYLTHQQVWALAEAAGEYRAIVLVLAYSGMRWGEMRALQGCDVDLASRRIQVRRNVVNVDGRDVEGTPKSWKPRSVVVPAKVAMELRRHNPRCAPTALFFPGADGGFLERTHKGSGWFDRAVAESGIPRITPKGLRSTAASLAVSAGANVKALQKMFGHASAAMTLDVYADLFDDDLQAVASRLEIAMDSAGVGTMWADDAATA